MAVTITHPGFRTQFHTKPPERIDFYEQARTLSTVAPGTKEEPGHLTLKRTISA
jgi:hypothetical protein